MKFVKFVGVKCLAAWAVGIYQKKDRNNTFLSSKIQAMNYLSINLLMILPLMTFFILDMNQFF